MRIEEEILKTTIEKESWEEIIYFIISKERLDPWNIDLIKLTDSFLKFLHDAKDLDFRIPAKVVFVAALLLRLKAEYLKIFEEEKEEKEVEKVKIDTSFAKIQLPIKRFPKAQVTLDDLIKALRKALEVKERKERKRKIIYQQLQQITFEEDIIEKMSKLMIEIENLMKKFGKEKIEFREIVKEWKRDAIVDNFVPLLHLEQNRKIKMEQENFFEEIYIFKPTSSK